MPFGKGRITDPRIVIPQHLLDALDRPFPGANPDGWYDELRDSRNTLANGLDEFGAPL